VKVHGNQVWAVGIVTMLRTGRSEVRIVAGTRRFSLLYKVQTECRAHPTAWSVGNGVLSYGQSGRDVKLNIEVKKEWSYPAIPPIRLRGLNTNNSTFFTFKDYLRLILKWALQEVLTVWLDAVVSIWGLVTEFYKHCNKPWGLPKRGRNFFSSWADVVFWRRIWFRRIYGCNEIIVCVVYCPVCLIYTGFFLGVCSTTVFRLLFGIGYSLRILSAAESIPCVIQTMVAA